MKIHDAEKNRKHPQGYYICHLYIFQFIMLYEASFKNRLFLFCDANNTTCFVNPREITVKFPWRYIIRESSLQNNVPCLVEASVEFI